MQTCDQQRWMEAPPPPLQSHSFPSSWQLNLPLLPWRPVASGDSCGLSLSVRYLPPIPLPVFLPPPPSSQRPFKDTSVNKSPPQLPVEQQTSLVAPL